MGGTTSIIEKRGAKYVGGTTIKREGVLCARMYRGEKKDR